VPKPIEIPIKSGSIDVVSSQPCPPLDSKILWGLREKIQFIYLPCHNISEPEWPKAKSDKIK